MNDSTLPVQDPTTTEISALIDAAVNEINEIATKTVYKGAEEIGEYLLINFFNNKIELALSKNPKKQIVSYRKLCERPDLLVNPGRLSEMVRVAAQERFFKDKQFNSGELSYTHKAELIKIKDDIKKLEIAKEVISNSLSTRELAEKVKLAKTTQSQEVHGSESFYKQVTSYVGLLSDLSKESGKIPLQFDINKLERMGDKRKKEFLEKADETINKMKEWLTNMQKSYNNFIKFVEELKKEKAEAETAK